MMFADDIQKIPIEKACPLNTDDLMLILSEDVALGLCNMQNDQEQFFSIKSLMLKEEIFGCTEFEKTCEGFSKILSSRIERFYITEKAKYIFFDGEEQQFLKNIFKNNRMNCTVTVFIDEGEGFKSVEFETMNAVQFSKVKKYLREYKVKYVIRPERYFELKATRDKKAEDFKNKFSERQKILEKKQMEEYFEKYSELKDITTPEQFTKLYKLLAKKYHPDRNPDNPDKFTKINLDFEKIQETIWFKNLGAEKEKPKSNQAEPEEPQSLFTKKKGFVYKAFKYMNGK